MTTRLILGAVTGDYLCSVFEKRFLIDKAVTIPQPSSRFTDDSVLTVAIADALTNGLDIGDTLRKYWVDYPKMGYGGGFSAWASSSAGTGYNSYGNGSAMRASPAGWLSTSEAHALVLGELTALPTHNHLNGIVGAQIVALAIYYGKSGLVKEVAIAKIRERFSLAKIDVDECRASSIFIKESTATANMALECLARGLDFEGVIREAIYLGGDTDTIAAIAGSMAEAFMPLKDDWCTEILKVIPADWLKKLVLKCP